MTQLVGIVNVTPDSFSDGGQFLAPDSAIAQAEKLFADGASLVDVGAESTRPHATALADEEEWERLEPVLQTLVPKYPGQISVDSYHPATIKKALALGDIIVNDISGLQNDEIFAFIAEKKPKVIISHLPAANAQTVHQQEPITSAEQVRDDLLATTEKLISLGMPKKQIVLDPGIGFGKTMELNWELLKFAELVPDYAVMIGHSRKRFLGEHRMEIEPNLAAARVAIEHGAAYLRVHDVAAHAPLISNS
jgi:dihydropteroate synthase